MRAAKNKRKKKELKLAYLKKQGFMDKSKHFEKDDDDTGFLEVDEADDHNNG